MDAVQGAPIGYVRNARCPFFLQVILLSFILTFLLPFLRLVLRAPRHFCVQKTIDISRIYQGPPGARLGLVLGFRSCEVIPRRVFKIV